MKFYPTQMISFDSPIIKRAYEIINDLTLEYGVPVFVDLEQSTFQISPGLFDDKPDTGYCITGVRFCVNEHKFENIKDLRKALENKAFI